MFHLLNEQMNKKGGPTPFLFLYSQSSELYYEKLYRELWALRKDLSIDAYSIYRLKRDQEDTHKITQVKKFIDNWNIRPGHGFQVFVFEDFWRLTVQAQNACLKFIEEPWNGNIIILTAPSEKGILDTILSRVQIYNEGYTYTSVENPFFISLIKNALSWDKISLVKYFFSQKREKEEYVDFLKTLLYYLIQESTHLHLHKRLHDDIIGIESNNFIARSIVDIYILEL